MMIVHTHTHDDVVVGVVFVWPTILSLATSFNIPLRYIGMIPDQKETMRATHGEPQHTIEIFIHLFYIYYWYLSLSLFVLQL